MKPSIKRLAKDQVALRRSLPPNYFFEDEAAGQSLPDDLTQLIICLTGPEGTPYSQGLWYLRLDIPLEYPQHPPTATFTTRIFHPNVAEDTGAVCLETLKRDWDPKLTLKDILVTISCLLIQPNPDSALNQKAGSLIQEDYDAFARQAKLMTRIHAPIPDQLLNIAQEARRRGEEKVDRTRIAEFSSSTDHSKFEVQKENCPQENEVSRASEPKTTKRSIAEVFTPLEPLQAEADTNVRRRKSPKHSHTSEELMKDKPIDVSTGEVESIQLTSKELLLSLPEKIIFRAQWSTASGSLRSKARIGIRRL